MSRGGGMNEDTRIIGLWTNISEQLGEIAGQMKSVLSQLADHTLRIQQLERHPSNQPVNVSKDGIIRWLLVALIASLAVIVTLTGATAVLKALVPAIGG